MIKAGAQLAAQPGEEEGPLHARAELSLPASFEVLQQGLQKLFAEGRYRIERRGLVEQIVEASLGQRGDGVQQLFVQAFPGGFDIRRRGFLRTLQQRAHLADGDATLEPDEYPADALDLLFAVEPVTLAGALRHHQAVAALPGAQGDRMDAGQTSDFADRQAAAFEVGRVHREILERVAQAEFGRVRLQVGLLGDVCMRVATEVVL